MLSRRLGNLFRGCIVFRVSGGFLPEFLAQCTLLAVPLVQTKSADGILCGQTSLPAAAALREAAEKAGMTLEIVRTYGIPVLWRRYGRRWGIPAGLLAGALLAGLLSSMVWSVRVTGCENLSEEYVLSWFAGQGVRKGVFRQGVDVVAVRDAAIGEIEGLLWITLHIDGCFAEIELRERGVVPVLPEKSRCTNLIAARSGELLQVEVLAGESTLQAGQPVVKGDLLVSGTVPLENGGTRFVRAQANITARTHREVRVSVAAQLEVQRILSERPVRSLCIFGQRIPLWLHGSFDAAESSSCFLSSGKTVLPLGYSREWYRKTEMQTVALSDKQLLLLSFARYAAQELALLEDTVTIERSLAASFENGVFTITGHYICEEDICEEAEVEIETEPETETETETKSTS